MRIECLVEALADGGSLWVFGGADRGSSIALPGWYMP
jgi:hypothetical protein